MIERWFTTWWKARGGSFALYFALLSPVLLGSAAGAVDILLLDSHRSALQDAADSAVLAAAKEAQMKGWDKTLAEQIVMASALSNLRRLYPSTVALDYDLDVDASLRRVKLDLTQDHYGYFFISYFTGSPQIRVRAEAQAAGQMDLCVLARSEKEPEALKIDGRGTLVADGCSVYSNSIDTKGIGVRKDGYLHALMTCSGGGYAGSPNSFAPTPVKDCPQLVDPMASRAADMADGIDSLSCSSSKLKVENKNVTLEPGAHCGGLSVGKNGRVQLSPGIHVIRNGELKVEGGGTLTGTGVTLIFSKNDNTRLSFKNDSTISMTAPTTGVSAGVLLYAVPGSKAREFKIESKNAGLFTGTIYLPNDRLVVGGDADGDGVCDADAVTEEDDEDDDDEDEDGDDESSSAPAAANCDATVGSASPWTAIVARKITVTAGADLVVKSDYDATPIPVPPGLGPNSTRLTLVR